MIDSFFFGGEGIEKFQGPVELEGGPLFFCQAKITECQNVVQQLPLLFATEEKIWVFKSEE